MAGVAIGIQYLASIVARLRLTRLIDDYVDGGHARLVGRIGAVGVIAGTALLVVAGAGVGADASVAGMPLLMVLGAAVSGLGNGTFTTASNASVATSVPVSRRAEAIGYFGLTISIGQAVGAGTGYSLFQVEFAAPFVAAIALMIVGTAVWPRAAVVSPLSEAAERVAFDPRILGPSLAMFLYVVGHSSNFAFVPLLASARHIDEPGVYYLAQAFAAAGGRLFIGRIADARGRMAVLVPGLLLAAVGLFVTSQADSTLALGIAGFLIGLAFVASHSTLQTLAVDTAGPRDRGAAIAMSWIAGDTGVVVGSVLGGFGAGVLGYDRLFLALSIFPLLSLLALVTWRAIDGRAH